MRKFLSVLLAVMMVLSTVSFAAPSAFGVIDAAFEMPAVDTELVEAEAALAAFAELPEKVSGYGQLLFELTFDDLTELSEGKVMFKDAGWVNPEGECATDLVDRGNFDFTAYPTYSLKERAAGDKYIELSGGTGYAAALVHAGYQRFFQKQDGIYTLTADVYRPDNMEITTRFTGTTPSTKDSEDTPIQDFSELSSDGWGYMILQHDPSCFGNGGHDPALSSVGQVHTVKFHRNGGTEDKTVGYDNIRLYYKPLTVEATVIVGSTEVKLEVPTTGFTVADLKDELGLDFYADVAGIYVNGESYGINDVVYVGADCEIEVDVKILDANSFDYEKGIAIFNIDFESHDVGTAIATDNANFNLEAYTTEIGKRMLSHPASDFHLNSSGLTFGVLTDPTNPANKVAGLQGATHGSYPALIVTTYANGAMRRYGFIEEDNNIYTIEYDYYDTTKDGVAIRFGGKSSIAESVPHQSKPGEFYRAWETLEDVPTETSIGRQASVWYKNIGEMLPENYVKMGSSADISFIKMHTASPQNADLYWDNVKVYVRPEKASVKINANGTNVYFKKQLFDNVATTGVVVKELLDDAGLLYDANAYTLKGVSFDTEGTKVYGLDDTIKFGGDSTLYLQFEEASMSEWIDEKGILLYDINFDNLPNGTKINQHAKLSTFGRVNPNISGSEEWYLNISQFGTESNNDYGVVENGVLKFTKMQGGRWAQIQISNENGGKMIISDGIIYKEADMMYESTMTGITLGLTGYARKWDGSKWTGTTSNQNSVKTIMQTEAKTWYSLSGSKVLAGEEFNSESCTIYLPTYPAEGGIGDTLYLDNLKMYWKPASVKVVVYGGSNKNYETQIIEVPTGSSVEDIIAALPGDTYGKITSLANMEGDIIDSFTAISDAFLVAVWTPWEVIEGGQSFPIDGEYYSKSTQFSGSSFGGTDYIGNGNIVTKTYITMYVGKKDGDYGIYTTNNDLVYKQLTPTAGDSYQHGNNVFSDDYTVAAVLSGSDHRVTINLDLAAGNDADYIVIKYKFKNIPDLNSDFAKSLGAVASADGLSATFTNRAGATATYSKLVDYTGKYYIKMKNGSYQYGGGEEFEAGTKAAKNGDGVTVNLADYEDVWMYDFLPVNDAMKTNGVASLLIDRPNHFRDQITVWDYVSIVKEGTVEEDVVLPNFGGDETTVRLKAPVSLEEETALRYANIDEDEEKYGESRNGIRFKATVTAKDKLNATHIGWLITSEARFVDAGYAYSELTIDAVDAEDSSFIKVAYQKLDGINMANFFDTADDKANVFSAVLYGIPEDNYASYILVRPFVSDGTKYYYGEPYATCMYDLASEIYYDDDWFWSLDEDMQIYIEDIVIFCEDEGLV